MSSRETASSTEDGPPVARNRPLLLALAVLVVVSAAVAAVVIFSAGGSSPKPPEPTAQLRISGDSLLVGDADARRRVEVRERFGDPQSRAFDLASRDFLRIEAAQGGVLVTYRPQPEGGYGRQAMRDWSAATDTGNPQKALALHDRIFDRQPAAAANDAGQLPVVLLDGQRLDATDGTELADRLQRQLLAD